MQRLLITTFRLWKFILSLRLVRKLEGLALQQTNRKKVRLYFEVLIKTVKFNFKEPWPPQVVGGWQAKTARKHPEIYDLFR